MLKGKIKNVKLKINILNNKRNKDRNYIKQNLNAINKSQSFGNLKKKMILTKGNFYYFHEREIF